MERALQLGLGLCRLGKERCLVESLQRCLLRLEQVGSDGGGDDDSSSSS